MVMSPTGLGTKNDCAGEGRQQFTRTDQDSHVQLDKEKPCIGSLRDLNLAEVMPTTIQVTAISKWINKLRHDLLHKPALTEVVCISYINIIYYSTVTKCVWCP
jgi:hypothetical protein